ncbi:SMP-30/gluconolactonase/LRE family protein [Crossiella cryophila]|uniref:Sugar lactone lactonase YvrE n=1 Tax=Crossiella cryophila TaxID=43355 RepID=A0A7W7CIR1_9PSEU|nr:hypothetical protein [Crossiella cryophila]MBB4681973.1 sugar lactone lactonase YvrE [Crossiella cryophila]
MLRRTIAALVIGSLSMLTPTASAAPPRSTLTALPGNEVFPESIAVDQRTGVYYVGSVKDGTLFRGRVGSPEVTVFSPAGADGRTIANGLALDGDRLIVLGRQTGKVHVYDTRTARLVTTLHNGEPSTFLNDLTVHPGGGYYVTDSINPWLYRIQRTGDGYRLEKFLDFTGTPLTYTTGAGAAGINVNGIVSTSDGRHLIVSKRNENALYRITLATKHVVKIATPPGALETQDGLFLTGRTLYAAQNLPRNVAVLHFAADYASATLTGHLGDPSLRFPTGVVRHGNRLLVVNAQFDSKGSPAAVTGPNPPVLPFGVTTLPLT